MMDVKIVEIHMLVEYIFDKDDQKIIVDEIYEINQKIFKLQIEYDLKRNALESKYSAILENDNLLAKQKMQGIIKEYKIDTGVIKENVSQLILEIRSKSNQNNEEINKKRSNAMHDLELELKTSILKIVKGYENNDKINVDWDYLNEQPVKSYVTIEEKKIEPVIVQFNENYRDKIYLDNFNLINSFGHAFDEIKSEQVLQIVADITNIDSDQQDFIYMVEIKDDSNTIVQPTKWIKGMLNSNQTLNVGLSWIPKETGSILQLFLLELELILFHQWPILKLM